MATRNFKQILTIGRTRAGYKKAIKVLESRLSSETLEDCVETMQLREELLGNIIELSNKLKNSINPSQHDYKLLEFFQKCLNYIDKKIIPGINKKTIHGINHDLSKIEDRATRKINAVKSSNYKDKKYGFRTKRVPDRKEYKRDRDIARTNKKKRQWWLAS